MNWINHQKAPVLVIIMFIAAAGFVFAALPQNASEMVTLMWSIVNWVFTFFIIVAAIYIIIAAFMYLTAQGDAEEISKAKRQLIYAIIAIVIASLSELIVYSIAGIVGATIK